MTHSSSIHVLVIDDDSADRMLLRLLLERNRDGDETIISIVEAASLAEASVAIQKARFDVVLLDLGLPESSGIDTLPNFRRIDTTTPFIVLSGLGEPDVREAAEAIGAVGCVQKGTIGANELRALIREAASMRQPG
ncbi:MAG: response regulator [Phycisphaerales bacterium]